MFTLKVKYWQIAVVVFALYFALIILANKTLLAMSSFQPQIYIILCTSSLLLCLLSLLLYHGFKKAVSVLPFAAFYKQCNVILSVICAVLLGGFCVLLPNEMKLFHLLGNSIGNINGIILFLLTAVSMLNWIVVMLMPQKTKFSVYQSILLPAVSFLSTGIAINLSKNLAEIDVLINAFLFFMSPIVISLLICLAAFLLPHKKQHSI